MRFDVTGMTADQIERLVPALNSENVFLYRNGPRAFLAQEIELTEEPECEMVMAKRSFPVHPRSQIALAQAVGKSI